MGQRGPAGRPVPPAGAGPPAPHPDVGCGPWARSSTAERGSRSGPATWRRLWPTTPWTPTSTSPSKRSWIVCGPRVPPPVGAGGGGGSSAVNAPDGSLTGKRQRQVPLSAGDDQDAGRRRARCGVVGGVVVVGVGLGGGVVVVFCGGAPWVGAIPPSGWRNPPSCARCARRRWARSAGATDDGLDGPVTGGGG